jgi:hypothetical protein
MLMIYYEKQKQKIECIYFLIHLEILHYII